MEEIIRLAAKTLTDNEEILYSNTTGSIVKTIILYNTNSNEKEVTLNLDGVTFLFKLSSNEVKLIDGPIVTNLIKAKGVGINIHVSAIQI